MCPATENIPDFYRIKNSYSNVTERLSFNLEIITCNIDVHNDCATDEDISEFSDKIILTQYFLQETINYRDSNNYGKKPTRVESIFYSQFSLNYNGYRDNNNYI